jgi:hypothetical protein
VPALEHCSVERLAELFASCQEEIMDEWRLQAGELLRDLQLDKPTLTDHLPDLVAEITRDLSLNRAICRANKFAETRRRMACSVFTTAWMLGK